METRNDILKELREIAPELAKLSKANPYAAPENYFLNFSAGILEKVKYSEVKEELADLAPALSKLKEQAPATPPGYFSSFSSALLEKIRKEEVNAELKEVAPMLQGLQKVNNYEAPAGYFVNFPTSMHKKIAVGEVRPESVVLGWLTRLNAVLDEVVSTVFKPQYTFAFAGSLATMVIVAMIFFKTEPVIEECAKDDLLCQLDKVSSADLDAYLSEHSDEFHHSVLEVSTDDKRLQNSSGMNNDAFLNTITDEELNSAILD